MSCLSHCLLLVTSLLSTAAFAGSLPQQTQEQKKEQSSAPAPQTAPAQRPDPDAVVRITTQLVQIDAVVTDKKGEHADDLSENDFELYVDGKKQTLSYFRLVKLPDAPKIETTPPNKHAPPVAMPAKMPEMDQVKRVVAFVVDDLGLSFASTYYTREALKKFVSTQMQEGDLIAIIRTGRGLGALQQFTTDKRVLYTAIEKLTWNPQSRDMIPHFGNTDNGGGDQGQRSNSGGNNSGTAADRIEDFRERVFSVGTLGAVNFVVRGMRELPGRKIAVVISDGFRLFGQNHDNDLVLQRVRRLVDLANRSSVVIYSLDAKGLLAPGPTAADNMGGVSPQQLSAQYSMASQTIFESQEGLAFLARETGGFAIFNNNDLNLGVQKILRDNRSYYLLGFDPEDMQFNGRYHQIKVKLKRSDLRVRTREGFFGVPESEARERKPQTPGQQILSALFSPFGARDLQMQMTSFFFESQKGGSFVRSLFHIEPAGLTFKDTHNGWKQVVIDFATFTFDERGIVIESDGRTHTLDLDEDKYRRLLAKGMDFEYDTVIKKPGAYQFRAVIRDAETARLGASGQFIQVPDLKKKHLAVSGLLILPVNNEPLPATQAGATDDQQRPVNNPQSTAAMSLRHFARTDSFEYGLMIYNAQLDKQTKLPKLASQLEIYRDGKPIFQGQTREVPVEATQDLQRISIGGRLQLKALAPGDYLLHLIVTDSLAKPKYSRAEQWMDFSVR